MSDVHESEAPLFSIGALACSFIAAAVLTFCAPQPAYALTLEQCATHATFARALADPEISYEGLEAWVVRQPQEEHAYFQQISEFAQENLPAVRAMTPDQFGALIMRLCSEAVEEGTI